jgi:integrase
LTDTYVRSLLPEARAYLVWDLRTPGLAVAVYPTGTKSWKVIYPHRGKSRWFSIGKVAIIDAEAARKLAVPVLLQVAAGADPQAERTASRGTGTFEELHDAYLEQHAKLKNKSWRQADGLIKRHLMPRWANLPAAGITRSDVKAALAQIASTSTATQTLRAAGAVFSWAVKEEAANVKVNPCQRIDAHESQSRERVLSDSEIPQFWRAFDHAGFVQSAILKTILLTGQRPGEVRHMHRRHIVDGWWEMPGAPVPELKWPGTKNGQSHRVWLPHAVQSIIAGMDGDGLVFAGPRGAAVDVVEGMQAICAKLEVPRATPHDLRRTHGTTITALRFGRDAMNRIQNHKDGGIASVYDRHEYADENKQIMETVAAHIMSLVEGREGKVIAGKFRRHVI